MLIKDFSSFAQKLTDRIKEGAYELFRKAGRPIQYLTNSENEQRGPCSAVGNSLKIYDKQGNVLRLETIHALPAGQKQRPLFRGYRSLLAKAVLQARKPGCVIPLG